MTEQERQAKLEKLHDLLISYEMEEEGLAYEEHAAATVLFKRMAETRRQIAELETNQPRYT